MAQKHKVKWKGFSIQLQISKVGDLENANHALTKQYLHFGIPHEINT
jgi:hypothetical protein